MGQILRFCTLLIPNLLLIPSKEKGKYSLGCMLRKKNSFDDQLAAFATDTESQTLKYKGKNNGQKISVILLHEFLFIYISHSISTLYMLQLCVQIASLYELVG